MVDFGVQSSHKDSSAGHPNCCELSSNNAYSQITMFLLSKANKIANDCFAKFSAQRASDSILGIHVQRYDH